MMRFCLIALCVLWAIGTGAAPAQSYHQPDSKGFRIQHGFEAVLVQPFGYDGFRVRVWPFRPPTGQEIGFIYLVMTQFGSDLYKVNNDTTPLYSFKVTKHAT